MPPPTRDPSCGLTGLSSDEVEARRRAGEADVAVTGTSRGYLRILRTNVFNLDNSILFAIGATLLALGSFSDAVIGVGVGKLNAAISAVQEIRAQRRLDRVVVYTTLYTLPSDALAAQTGLSTFASWTAPSPDRRPTLLTAGLIAVLLVVLFTPSLSRYFDLTRPALPVLLATVPALALWFLALSAAYRFRLLDRALGTNLLPKV